MVQGCLPMHGRIDRDIEGTQLQAISRPDLIEMTFRNIVERQ